MPGLDRRIILTPRLEAVYALLGTGRCVADIGTDHAYLPARLVLDGRFRRAIASDVAPGPLENARRTVDALDLGDRIELRLAPGLSGIKEGEADAASIAGMGGELAGEILLGGPVPPYCVLQPMSREEKLRALLWENGFSITGEKLAREGERIYVAMGVVRTGEKKDFRASESYIGRVFLDNDPDLARAYLARRKASLRKAETGSAQAGNEEAAALCRQIREEIEEYEKGF